MYQKRGEPATTFIPTVYKLIKLVHPKADELTAVDKIMDKLLPETLRGLALEDIDSMSDLCEKATAIEDSQRRIDAREAKIEVNRQLLVGGN